MYEKNVVVNDGFIELATYLKMKNRKIGIISNIPYPDEIFINIFKNLDLNKFIDHFVFSYSNVYMKPHESMYTKALMNFGINPNKALMIGDNYNADILGAQNAGIKACLYDNKNNKEKLNADYYISSFYELLKQI